MNGAKAPVKTCYKCKTDGHVRFFLSLLGYLLGEIAFILVHAILQIARDCPEGREPVEEEDNAWGEVEEGPWASSGGALPADGSQGMH